MLGEKQANILKKVLKKSYFLDIILKYGIIKT